MKSRTSRHAVSISRVRVPPGKASERPVAGPRCGAEKLWPKRGVESLVKETGSEAAGRNAQ